MTKKLSTCLWFNDEAEDAVAFYATVFKNVRKGTVARYGPSASKAAQRTEGTVMTVAFSIEDQEFLGLNGGPAFKFTPALSFFVACDSEAEIDAMWAKLSAGGNVRMQLGKFPWAAKYGWTADRFGVEWQLILMPLKSKIVPAFLFVEELFGKGEEAVNLYTSLFPDSRIDAIQRDDATKSIQHCAFTLAGQGFVLMEGQGNHGFTFNEAASLVVACDSQEELDALWAKLTANGGEESMCGWLKDRFGVSWQLVPRHLEEWMKDPARGERVMAEVMQMRKLDLGVLERAARGA